MNPKILYLAWQAPDSRKWYPIGQLSYDGQIYQFVYTKGVDLAKNESSFRPVESFPELNNIYEAEKLFPIFQNRLLPKTRSDYREFLSYLGISDPNTDELLVLETSGGKRATDSYEVFAKPQLEEDGTYRFTFFAHGLNHLSEASLQRIETLEDGERLLLSWDLQNPYDRWAMMLRTEDSHPNSKHVFHHVGYCPRYFVRDIIEALKHDSTNILVEVEHVNPSPAPLQLRLRCKITARWPEGSTPLSGPDFEPLIDFASDELG